MPVIVIAPAADFSALDDAIRSLLAFDWVVFTSRNAVDAYLSRRRHLGLTRSCPKNLRVAAVGRSTAERLRSSAMRVDCVPEEPTSLGLAVALRELGIAGERVLLPVGNLSRPELREELEALGAEVVAVEAYRTLRPDAVDPTILEMIRGGKVDIITLTSPSAIRNLAGFLAPDTHALRSCRLVAIGPTTAAAVSELGLEVGAVADEPSDSGLVSALMSVTRGLA